MKPSEWVIAHWQELLAALSIGGAGGVAGKKLTDKQQDERIKTLAEDVAKIRQKTHQLSNELNNQKIEIMEVTQLLETNTKFDKQHREDLAEHRNALDKRLTGIEASIKDMFKEILELNRKK